MLNELGLRDSVIEVGLEYNVGVGGKRLPATQRQKLGIARALIKRPQLLVVNEAVAAFDGRTQDRIRDNILATASKDDRGVVWIANRANAGGAVRADRCHAGWTGLPPRARRRTWRQRVGCTPS